MPASPIMEMLQQTLVASGIPRDSQAQLLLTASISCVKWCRNKELSLSSTAVVRWSKQQLNAFVPPIFPSGIFCPWLNLSRSKQQQFSNKRNTKDDTQVQTSAGIWISFRTKRCHQSHWSLLEKNTSIQIRIFVCYHDTRDMWSKVDLRLRFCS